MHQKLLPQSEGGEGRGLEEEREEREGEGEWSEKRGLEGEVVVGREGSMRVVLLEEKEEELWPMSGVVLEVAEEEGRGASESRRTGNDWWEEVAVGEGRTETRPLARCPLSSSPSSYVTKSLEAVLPSIESLAPSALSWG